MENKPQITTSEVQEWENKFKESVSPLVQFTNDGTGNGSMKLYNGQSGVEASWAGTIVLNNDNYIKWTFSIQNEPFIECKLNFNENNQMILTNLYNFYQVWKEEWSKHLSIPGGNQDDVNNISGGQSNPAEPTPASPEQAQSPINENLRTKAAIIANHKARMQKLSGLR